jgi:hypothetical protein
MIPTTAKTAVVTTNHVGINSSPLYAIETVTGFEPP